VKKIISRSFADQTSRDDGASGACAREFIHSTRPWARGRRRRARRRRIARAARGRWRDASTRAMGIIFTFDRAGRAPRWTRAASGKPTGDARAWGDWTRRD
jgi:hypothetical protein